MPQTILNQYHYNLAVAVKMTVTALSGKEVPFPEGLTLPEISGFLINKYKL
jgi:hypothetical protein